MLCEKRSYLLFHIKIAMIKTEYDLKIGGIVLSLKTIAGHREKAYELLKADANKILKLIEVQMENLTMPQCPLLRGSSRYANVWLIKGN